MPKNTCSLKLILPIALLFFSSLANATYTDMWTDEIDFNPDEYLDFNDSFTYTHDLTDDGFDPGIDHATLLHNILIVELYDDAFFDPSEIAHIKIPGFDAFEEVDFIDIEIEDLGILAKMDINDDGLLDVTIESDKGDFYVGKSTLIVTGFENYHAVPEPGTLGLLSLGLFGMLAGRKIKLSRK